MSCRSISEAKTGPVRKLTAGFLFIFLIAPAVFAQNTSDLAIVVSDSPDPVRVGTNLTYSIAVSNAGPHSAGSVSVTDILPTNMNFLSCALSQGSYVQSEDTVTCNLGTLAAGATAAVTIVVAPALEGTVINNVSVDTSSVDTNTANNRASCTTTILAQNRPPQVIFNPEGPYTLVVGCSTSFVVYAQDPEHTNALTITNTVKPSGATYINSNFSWSATASFAGTTNPVVFVADDHAGESYSVVTSITYIVVPFDGDADGMGDGWEWNNFLTLTNGPGGDVDNDSQNNYAEWVAGTQPTNEMSVFRVLALAAVNSTSNRNVTVSTEPNRKYTIYFANGMYSNSIAWSPFFNASTGVWTETRGSTNYTFTDNESTNTAGALPASGIRYYKVKVGFP